MHPGLASVQLVYSGFGNYIVGEWPTIGHKWLLSVGFVLMDGAPHGHILQRNGEISNNSNNRLCWSQRQVALAWLVHTIFANGSELSNQNAQLECFRMLRRFPDVSDKEHNLSLLR
jgi:hypothetical protein